MEMLELEGNLGRLNPGWGIGCSGLNLPGSFPAQLFEAAFKSTPDPFFERGPWS